jgi:hypothetical protein
MAGGRILDVHSRNTPLRNYGRIQPEREIYRGNLGSHWDRLRNVGSSRSGFINILDGGYDDYKKSPGNSGLIALFWPLTVRSLA